MKAKSESNPFDIFIPDPAGDFPLTTGELIILAERWWDFIVDTEHFWVLANSVGSSERHDGDYAYDRLELLLTLLGADHIDRLREEALARWRGRYGEVYWAAVQAQRPLLQIDAWIGTHARRRSRAEPTDFIQPGEAQDYLNVAPLRAERFAGTLSLYPEDEHSNVVDLLADLLHWCREKGVDFEDTLRVARTHFESELAEK